MSSGSPSITLSSRARLAVVGAVMLGLFLSALDQTVVGTALPVIVTDLGGNSLYVWVVTSYLLTSTVTIPVYGKLSDIFGRKPMLMLGISLFLVGSALSGLSQNMAELIFFRGLQGLGAGALFPISLAIIGDLFTPRERGRYQGFFGAVFGLAFLVGPFLGGFITDNISWHWVFYVNLPVGLVALAVLAAVLPNLRSQGPRPAIDYLGTLVFTAAVVPLLIGLTEKGLSTSSGSSIGWLDWRVGGLLALSLVLAGVFVLVEARAKEPIVPLRLFRIGPYSASQAAMFLLSFAFYMGVIFMPRYYQAVKGVSATASGYMLWPLLLGLIGTSIGSGLLISRTGRYKWLLVGAMALATVGLLLMTQLGASTGPGELWAWMFVMGVGIGPSMSSYTVVVQNAVPQRDIGVATSNLTFFRQVGGAIGLAIAGTFLSSTFSSQLPHNLVKDGIPSPLVSRFGSGASSGTLTGVHGLASQLRNLLPPSLQHFIPTIVVAIHQSLAQAIGRSFWLGVVAAGLAVGCVLLMKELPLRTYIGDDGQPPTEDTEPDPAELVAAP